MQRLATGYRSLAEDFELRKKIVRACIKGLQCIHKDLASLVVMEVGKKPEEAKAEIDYAISFLSHCLDLLGNSPFEQRLADDRTVTDAGIGGALLICPYNDPVAGLTRKIAPAIAAGCPSIVKPSSLAMLCAISIFDAFRRHGVGCELQLLASGDANLVQRVLKHEEIDIVSFTGSNSVGRDLAEACARHGKKSVLELGGNCPFVVLADADQQLALGDLMERKLKAAGQACSSVNRVFVEEPIYRGFKDKLLDRADVIVAGPSDRGVDLGPVRTREHVNALVNCASSAREKGEKLLTGEPSRIGRDCPFVFPFSVVECGENSLFDQFETFGPLLSIRPFTSLPELLDKLAKERHLLAAYFYAADPDSMASRLQGLRIGSIGINSTAIQGADVPTGGFRDSGFGREGGIWGMREYLATVNFRIGSM